MELRADALRTRAPDKLLSNERSLSPESSLPFTVAGVPLCWFGRPSPQCQGNQEKNVPRLTGWFPEKRERHMGRVALLSSVCKKASADCP